MARLELIHILIFIASTLNLSSNTYTSGQPWDHPIQIFEIKKKISFFNLKILNRVGQKLALGDGLIIILTFCFPLTEGS